MRKKIIELCPFCGSYDLDALPDSCDYGNESFVEYFVECLSCSACGPLEDTEDMAIDAWNKQANKQAKSIDNMSFGGLTTGSKIYCIYDIYAIPTIGDFTVKSFLFDAACSCFKITCDDFTSCFNIFKDKISSKRVGNLFVDKKECIEEFNIICLDRISELSKLIKNNR